MKTLPIYALLLLCLLSSTSFAQTSYKRYKPKATYYLTSKDDWRYAFFTYDVNRDSLLFDKGVKASKLLPQDYAKIENLISGRVDLYNKSAFNLIEEPGKYYKQLIPVVNRKGEREVWVHCLCQVMKDDWKTHIINTKDGSVCYFDAKINLVYGTVTSFGTSGPGSVNAQVVKW